MEDETGYDLVELAEICGIARKTGMPFDLHSGDFRLRHGNSARLWIGIESDDSRVRLDLLDQDRE